jgi:hypothetical protein
VLGLQGLVEMLHRKVPIARPVLFQCEPAQRAFL